MVEISFLNIIQHWAPCRWCIGFANVKHVYRWRNQGLQSNNSSPWCCKYTLDKDRSCCTIYCPVSVSCCFFFDPWFFATPGIEHRTWNMPGKHSTTELHPWTALCFLLVNQGEVWLNIYGREGYLVHDERSMFGWKPFES